MKVADFYKNVLLSLGAKISSDDYIKLKLGDEYRTLTAEGKNMTLPTKAHADTLLYENEDGVIEVSKILYNPLNENVIKGDSASLKKTKDLVERRLAHTIMGAGELLLRLASNPKLQGKTSMAINTFLISLNEAKTQGVTDIVDATSVKNWSKIYKKTFEHNVDIVKVFLKKSAKYDGVKYNRLATTKFPLYEELIKPRAKDDKILDMNLRPKDCIVFKLIFEYLIADLEENNKHVVGSLDGESPGFISLFRSYLDLIKTPAKVITTLKDVDAEVYDASHIVIKVKPADLDNLAIYKTELLGIPSEIDVNRNKIEEERKAVGITPTASPVPATGNPAIVTPNVVPPTTQPDNNDALSKILGTPGFAPVMAVQQTPAPVSPLDQILHQSNMGAYNPGPIVPGGVNTVNQPMNNMVMPQNNMMMPNQMTMPNGIPMPMTSGMPMQQGGYFPPMQNNMMSNQQQNGYFNQQVTPIGIS